MNGHGKLLISCILLSAVAACDTSGGAPAGGYGYFDPPPPAPLAGPRQVPEAISTLPPNAGSAPQPGDPNAALAADVSAALSATGPGSTPAATPGSDSALVAEPGAIQTATIADTGIDPNDESINLNLTSQEQQKREREAAAALRQQQQEQLVVVAPTPVPQQDINANVVAFARETSHPVGTKRYNRPAFRDRLQASATCRRFGDDTEAQRQFLANGGPTTDRFNLDPDGDGFACGFNPEPFRSLNF